MEVLEHEQDGRARPERPEQQHQRLVHARLGEAVRLRTAAHREPGGEVRERALQLAPDLRAQLRQRAGQRPGRGVAQRGGQRRVGQLAAVEAQALAAQDRRAPLAGAGLPSRTTASCRSPPRRPPA